MLKLEMKKDVLRKHSDYILNESRILEKLNLLLKDGATIPVDDKKTEYRELDRYEKRFIRYLMKHIARLTNEKKYEKSLFLMTPEDMKKEVENIKRNHSKVYEKFMDGDDDFSRAILDALGYNKIFIRKNRIKKWGAYMYASSMDLVTCPYCNINDARTCINPKTKQSSRPELDHFLPKSQFPYFSMSIYNLVPSCHTCNSSYKGDKEFSYEDNINLFEKDMKNDLISFSYFAKNVEAFLGKDSPNLEIVVCDGDDPVNANRLNNNNTIFNIICRYNQDDVLKKVSNMILNQREYDERSATFRSLCWDRKKCVLGDDARLSDQEIIKSQYGKLKLDIFNELSDMYARRHASSEVIAKAKHVSGMSIS